MSRDIVDIIAEKIEPMCRDVRADPVKVARDILAAVQSSGYIVTDRNPVPAPGRMWDEISKEMLGSPGRD